MIYTALVLSRFYLRYIPIYQGKETLWKKLCRPYINWRGMKSVSKTRSGFKIYCDLQDIIQEKIVYFDEWEPNLTAFLNRRLKSGDVFIDIGANIGYYSLLAERLVGRGVPEKVGEAGGERAIVEAARLFLQANFGRCGHD